MATRTRRGARAEAPATTAETAPVQEDATMSDVNETAETETAEVQATEASTKHVFNAGDEANVIRGKDRGRKGTILKHNVQGKTYAVELEDGSLIVVNEGNLKAPVDSTISVRSLVGVLHGFPFQSPDDAVRFAAALDEVSPGFSAKLAEASATA